jgi:CRP/FNR family cyclic AMP-dependent transcriptional regulator
MISGEDLAAFAIFGGLTVAQRAAVADVASEVVFASGERLFEEEQPAAGCWLISTGRVALGTSFPGRGHVVVQTLGHGDVLGWSWLVPPHHWHLTAIADGPVSAVQLDTTRLRSLAQQDPAFGYSLALGLMESLLERLQSTRARLLDLYGSPRER